MLWFFICVCVKFLRNCDKSFSILLFVEFGRHFLKHKTKATTGYYENKNIKKITQLNLNIRNVFRVEILQEYMNLHEHTSRSYSCKLFTPKTFLKFTQQFTGTLHHTSPEEREKHISSV